MCKGEGALLVPIILWILHHGKLWRKINRGRYRISYACCCLVHWLLSGTKACACYLQTNSHPHPSKCASIADVLSSVMATLCAWTYSQAHGSWNIAGREGVEGRWCICLWHHPVGGLHVWSAFRRWMAQVHNLPLSRFSTTIIVMSHLSTRGATSQLL